MMTNLFSLFDPSLGLFSLTWVVFLSPTVFLVSAISLAGGVSYIQSLLLGGMKSEISYSLPWVPVGVSVFFSSIFLSISYFNFVALFPFLFSLTSHLTTTLPLSYSLWVGIILFIWAKSFSSFLSHLIPVGTPIMLMSFMVLVELLSSFIRPLALTFRLTANMMAGHLLMSLIGGGLINSPPHLFFIGSLFQSLLVLMELGVSVIQAYVFSTLLLLYLSESDNS